MVRKKLLSGRSLVVAVALLAAVACRASGPLQFEAIQTGKSLNSDNSVGTHGTRFRPDDTMFVSVITKGPGKGKVGVRWTYSGRLVSEEARNVSYRDTAATEFHIKNSSGFPAGEYAVEVFIDDKSVGSRNLKVEK